MKNISDELFDQIISELGICIPSVGFKLKDGNKECEFCKSFNVCQKIGEENLL
jgi:hypothetical protein